MTASHPFSAGSTPEFKGFLHNRSP